MSITFRVHWLSITIWEKERHGLDIWNVWFEQYLGPMQPSGHGGRGFKATYKALLEARMYAQPVYQDNIDNEYYCFDIPGQACDAIPDYVFNEFALDMRREKARFTRLDLAWDGVQFTPETTVRAIKDNHIRSYLRREKLSEYIGHYELRDDGQVGTSSMRLGSNHSQRLLRVYNQRGPVRVEFQTRSDRADAIAKDLLVLRPKEWTNKAISHLRDCIDFVNLETGRLLPWWEAFINNQDRAMKTISKAREVTLSKMFGWADKSWSQTLSVLSDALGTEAVDALLISGRRKRGNRFKDLLDGFKRFGDSN